MTTLSVFDAAREQPAGIAFIDGDTALGFADAARLTAQLAAALLAARPPVLALTPRADTQSLLWLYAAWATATPVLVLHARATEPEKRRCIALAGALPPPEPSEAAFAAAQLPEPRDDDPLVLIPTSGSSGAPRLVELSRRALVSSARASEHNLGWLPDDLWLLCLPLAHAGGLSIATRSLLARKPLLLFEPGEAGSLSQLDALLELARRATLVSLVPSLLQGLLDAGLTGESARLRAVLLGGAACTPALARRAHAAGLPLLTSYGLTETASQVVTRRYVERFEPLPEADGCVSSGHVLPGVELALRDGNIALRGPMLLSRYVAGGAPIDASLDGAGWLVTSDRAELGPRGELYVRGRSDDVIVTAGENVDPLEVEAALLELPGIEAACVFAAPSSRFGQVVCAVVVARDPRLGDAEKLAELLGDRLSRHKLPRRALCAESLPLTASGKLDRRACAAHYGVFLSDPPG